MKMYVPGLGLGSGLGGGGRGPPGADPVPEEPPGVEQVAIPLWLVA